MGELVYRLEGVAKDYGERRVLQIRELEVRRGEIFCIMGPSGTGKSTLLRLLNFLEPPTSGLIAFQGQTVRDYPPPLGLRRQVTMVFQEPLLLSTSVEGNVAYGLRLRKNGPVAPRVRQALERVGLSHLARAPALSLSGGEKQRVALARGLVLSSPVLLLDEPTADLDPYNVALVEELIQGANSEGSTIILVTHNVFQARRLAHRAALLLEGRVVEVGNREQLFTHPRDPRTAAFIRGEMVY